MKAQNREKLLREENVLILIYSCEFYKKNFKAVFNTWARDWPSKLIVYNYNSPEESPLSYRETTYKNVPKLVVGISKREELPVKSYVMWKYVIEKYGYSKKWFIKVDDDCFIRKRHLLDELSKFNPDKEWYLGHIVSWKRATQLFFLKLFVVLL